MAAVLVNTLNPPPIDKKEVLRYAGVLNSNPQIDALLSECIDEAQTALQYRVCHTRLPVATADGEIDLGFCRVKSKALAANLNGCSTCVLLAATIGVGIDRLIAKYGVLSPAKAVLLQAIGAERIEALCDAFELQFLSSASLAPRFSPGYGDFCIQTQREIFNALSCAKHIGLSLNDSYMMSPSKSVTAIIGIRNI